MLPTKPLFTVRFTLLNTYKYTPDNVLTPFKADLIKHGYKIYQTPAVKTYTAKYTISKEGPFPDDEEKSVFEIMRIMGPAGKETAVAKDLTNDKYGSRPILEKRLPIITAIAWNLGPPPNTTPQSLADLIWSIRKSRVMDPQKYTGLGFTPVCDTWTNTPLKLAPYPDRPPIPSSLTPGGTAPVPKVATPALDPFVPAPAPVYTPDGLSQSQALFGDWRLWATLGGISALALLGMDERKKA